MTLRWIMGLILLALAIAGIAGAAPLDRFKGGIKDGYDGGMLSATNIPSIRGAVFVGH